MVNRRKVDLGNLDGRSDGMGGVDGVRVESGTGAFYGRKIESVPGDDRPQIISKEIPGPTGPMGPMGPQGPKGDDGIVDYSLVQDMINAINLKRIQFKAPVPTEVYGTREIDFDVEFYDVIAGSAVAITPNWELSDQGAGDIASTGQFIASDVLNDKEIVVFASYYDGERNYETSTDLIVKALLPVKLTINGPSTLTGGNPGTYSVTVEYTDGTTRVVTSEATISRDPAAIGIMNGNVLSTPIVANSVSGAIAATFSEKGITVTDAHNVTVNPVPIRPFYGVARLPANSGSMTDQEWASFILNLSNRGPNANRLVPDISLCQAAGEYLWYAAPVSYGVPTFYDKDSGFTGGWDGANLPFEGIHPTIVGPKIISVTVDAQTRDFALYRTDYAGLGCPPDNQWAVQ